MRINCCVVILAVVAFVVLQTSSTEAACAKKHNHCHLKDDPCCQKQCCDSTYILEDNCCGKCCCQRPCETLIMQDDKVCTNPCRTYAYQFQPPQQCNPCNPCNLCNPCNPCNPCCSNSYRANNVCNVPYKCCYNPCCQTAPQYSYYQYNPYCGNCANY